MSTDTQALTQVEFDEADFEVAEKVAKRMGYTQTAYTSSSALWGLFCLPDKAWSSGMWHKRGGCLIKTKELGLMWVQNLEDLGLQELEAKA